MRNKLLALLLATVAQTVYGGDVTINDCNFASVKAALLAASDGDTISLAAQCDGLSGRPTIHWTEPLIVSKAIRLKGSNPDVTDPGVYRQDMKVIRDGTPISGGTPYNTLQCGDSSGKGPTCATDRTIIEDDCPTTSTYMVSFQGISANKPPINSVVPSVRVDHITFTGGNRTADVAGDGRINFVGDGTGGLVRMDNCHVKYPNFTSRISQFGGWIHLIVDHNFIEFTNDALFASRAGGYGGNSTGDIGHHSWADDPRYGIGPTGQGGDVCVFETNTVVRRKAAGGLLVTGYPHGLYDGDQGGRVVIRYNFLGDACLAGHGTEGVFRGSRAHEVYYNTQHQTGSSGVLSGQRSGSLLIHDNLNIGKRPIGTPTEVGNIQIFREADERPTGIYQGDADGAAIYDKNVTGVATDPFNKTQHTFVAGPTIFPYTFFSGKCTGTGNPSDPYSKMTDGTRNGTPGHEFFPTTGDGLKGYSIESLSPHVGNGTVANDMQGRPHQGSFIVSNTATEIVHAGSSAETGSPNAIHFQVGDDYEIHRVLQAIDSMGAAKTVLFSGNNNVILVNDNGPYKAGQRGYAYPVDAAGAPLAGSTLIEPCISWRNRYLTSGGAYEDIGLGRSVSPTNYVTVGTVPATLSPMPNCTNNQGITGPCVGYNLGPTPSPNPTSAVAPGAPSPVPTFVKNTYNATLNGFQYQDDYTYPHPCVANWPTCTSAAAQATKIQPVQAAATIGGTFSTSISSQGDVPPATLAAIAGGGATPPPTEFTFGGGTVSGGVQAPLAITSVGSVTGSPRTYNFKVQATNATGNPSFDFKLDVINPVSTVPSAPVPTSGSATVGQALTAITVTSSGNPTPTLSVSGTTPSWASFNVATLGQCVITGTPTNTTGSPFSFTITATNTAGVASSTFTLTVSPVSSAPTPASIIVKP